MRVLRPRQITLAFLCVILLVFAAPAFANDYYVSPAGSDSNDGSQARPWATVQHAIGAFSLASGGTTIHVAAGTYASGISINRGGSSTSVRLVLRCDSGVGSATRAIGQCKVTGSGNGISVTGNNVDVVGFDIGGNANMVLGVISIYQGSAVASTGGNSLHVIGNYIHDLAASVSGPNGVGCPANGAIQLNNQHGHTMTDQQAIGNLVVRFGTGTATPGCNQAQGIYAISPGSIIENNIVVGSPFGNIQITTPCNTIVSNNVMINAQAGLVLEESDSNLCPGGVPGLNTFNNNYFAGHSNTFGHVYWVSGSSACTNSTPNQFGSNMTDGTTKDFYSNFSCDTVTPKSIIHQTPTSFFVSYQSNGSGDYHLQSNSIAVNAGTTTCVSGGLSPCTPAVDFAGLTRLDTLSVGAYDVVQSGSTLPAPTGLTATVI